MNKTVKIIRYVLTLLLTLLITKYIIKSGMNFDAFGYYGSLFITLGIYVLYLVLNIIDIINSEHNTK